VVFAPPFLVIQQILKHAAEAPLGYAANGERGAVFLGKTLLAGFEPRDSTRRRSQSEMPITH